MLSGYSPRLCLGLGFFEALFVWGIFDSTYKCPETDLTIAATAAKYCCTYTGLLMLLPSFEAIRMPQMRHTLQ